jgi:N-methylhydantoinase A
VNERPTVTDANMVLGYLNPAALAGGSLEVDAELARRAVSKHVAAALGLTLLEAAHGIRQVANVNMARAIRAVTVERGRDPRDMSLVAFGGSGPVHAVEVARLLGIRRVVAPVMVGVFSALGMLAADAEHDFLRAVLRPIERCSEQDVRAILEALQRQGREALAAEGYSGAGASFAAKGDLRYLGQSSELTIPFSSLAQARADFQKAYAETFGYSNEEPVELVNLRLTARGSGANRLRFEGNRADASALQGVAAVRKVSFQRGEPPVDTPVIARHDMSSEARSGPLIVESYDTTVVVPPGVAARSDASGNIILHLEAS